jgi:hypothetical protein
LRARAQVQPAAPPPPPAARGRGAPRGGGRASAQPSSAARGRPRGSVSDRLGPRAQPTRVEASVGAGDPWTRSDPPSGRRRCRRPSRRRHGRRRRRRSRGIPPQGLQSMRRARAPRLPAHAVVCHRAASGAAPAAVCTFCRQLKGPA